MSPVFAPSREISCSSDLFQLGFQPRRLDSSSTCRGTLLLTLLSIKVSWALTTPPFSSSAGIPRADRWAVYGYDAFNLFACVAQRLLCATLQAWSYHTSSLRAARVDPIVVRSMIPYHILHTSLCHLYVSLQWHPARRSPTWRTHTSQPLLWEKAEKTL